MISRSAAIHLEPHLRRFAQFDFVTSRHVNRPETASLTRLRVIKRVSVFESQALH